MVAYSTSFNRRGWAVYPLRLWGLRFLNGVPGVASRITLISRSPYLLPSLALTIAASVRDDYGRAPATPLTHDYTVRTEAESPLDYGAAMRYEAAQQGHEGTAQQRINSSAKTCKCE
eukprot:4497795-Pleurochrysis_carterae.AAC.1